jgi:phage terminase small subunit
MARKPQQPREGPTLQQELFVRRYLETKPLNATKAYMDVYGVSREVAASAGARLLRNVRVAAFLAEKQKVLVDRSETTIEEVDADLACAARFDPKDILDENGATLPLHLWPERARLAIAG